MTPQFAAGQRIEPQVSEPIANGTSPAATAAPSRSRSRRSSVSFHGVPGPVHEAPRSVAEAARQLDHRELGHSTAPAASSFEITVAS